MPSLRRGRIRVFAVIFTLLLIAQGLLAWSMYNGSRSSLIAVQTDGSRRAAEHIAETVVSAGGTDAPAETLETLLRQVRDAQRLTAALIIGPDHAVIADAAGIPPGTPVNALATDPEMCDRAVAGETLHVSRSLEGESTTVHYFPLRGARPAALCIETFDPLPDLLGALRRPMLGVVALMILSALLLAALGAAARRTIEQAHQRVISVERLAAAGTLAASISHEVKNPMGIILSAARVLKKSPNLSDDDRALLRDIEEEVERADDQLNGLLDLTRDMPIKLETCDLAALARATVELMTPKAQGAGVALSCAADGPIPVSGDRRRLRQALVNLVLNALEACTAGGTVRVTASSDHALARITVVDDGTGVSDVVRGNLFTPFTTSKTDGTGLGLATTRRILERHGGRCELLSDGGKTTAIMELPLEQGAGNARPGG
jgi:signal transduction histidine kinase